MLQRRTTRAGVVYYASPLLEDLGIPHAFSTRIGGVSPEPFDSLNLGNPSGCGAQDDAQHLQENYRRLQAAVGLDSRQHCWAHQVHGAQALLVQEGEPFVNNQPADALVCTDVRRLVAVRVADCVPILLADRKGKVVAAVHAGWRGVVAAVAPAAVRTMQRLSVSPTDLFAAIGPCIGADAFEVGPEVLAEFAAAFGDNAPVVRQVGEKGQVDLRQAVRMQLLAAGIPPRHIDITDRCTYRDQPEFFSHRRDNGVTGRMAAIIGCK